MWKSPITGRMASFGMLRRVALVRTDVSEEFRAILLSHRRQKLKSYILLSQTCSKSAQRVSSCSGHKANGLNRRYSKLAVSVHVFVLQSSYLQFPNKQENGGNKDWGFWHTHFHESVKIKIALKNVAFWDVTPCGSCKNRRFGGT
jgi:hypothetical protein